MSILIYMIFTNSKHKKNSNSSSGESSTMTYQPRLKGSSVRIAKFSMIVVLFLLSSFAIATRGQQRLEVKALPNVRGP